MVGKVQVSCFVPFLSGHCIYWRKFFPNVVESAGGGFDLHNIQHSVL